MASHQFELISPGRPLVTKPVDWELCFVCQEDTDSSNLVRPYRKPGKCTL